MLADSTSPSEGVTLRSGSPWDDLLSARSEAHSPASLDDEGAFQSALTRSPWVVPKLVPEIEEGNVEYKLRLLHPPPERFARLVTQLKWRLLAGAGQAYYELGVADSGALVGLSRKHLEESLMTLEEMAGEIGASVIVVKEIELPPALVAAAQTEVLAMGVGALRMPKTRAPGAPAETELSLSASDGEEETELPTPEDVSPSPTDDAASDAPSSLYLTPNGWTCTRRSFAHSFADTALSQSPSLVIGRSNASSNSNLNLDGANSQEDSGAELDFEIASVYKPRPYRRRSASYAPMPDAPPLSAASSSAESDTAPPPSAPLDVPAPRAGKRGKKSNKRKFNNAMHALQLVVDVGSGDGGPGAGALGRPTDTVGTRTHMRALDELEEAAALFGAFSFADEPEPGPPPDSTESSAQAQIGAEPDDAKSARADAFHRGQLVAEDATQKRFIVEALVVRKMSMDEVRLDFMTL